jgi:diphosphomevalonate decarboxylase
MKKTTVKASSDVALIKYWGKKDEKLRLPENGSISLVLDGLDTTTTVEFQSGLSSDTFMLDGAEVAQSSPKYARVMQHLDRIRMLAGITIKARVVSQNNFPADTGLSSSGSGMAALTCAAANAAGLSLSEKELSILARQASGTACRCVCGGFVEWKDGDTSETSYSETLYPADHWDLVDVIAVVSKETKKISSTQGHSSAKSSPFYEARQTRLPVKTAALKQVLAEKNFSEFGKIVEAEALEFHSILLTSEASLIALLPGSIAVMHTVRQLRAEGVEAYFTINTGFNVHVLTLPQFQETVEKRLQQLSAVQSTLIARPGEKPKEITDHLF